MKLDVSCMRYLTKDDYRVLTAVEMGMRNHELVPVELITSIARLRHGGSHKILSKLLRYKLLAHDSKKYNGYRLSYLGFDILALRTLLSRGIIVSVGSQIGVGKESDIFEAQNEDGEEIVLKLHRLGRTSFRSVRKNRDYMAGKNKASWLYMSRLAAIKEYAFMEALHKHDFPTPVPIDQNRHVVVMSRVHGFPMAQIKSGNMAGAGEIFEKCVKIMIRLAECGLVHCDFNEFNIMTDEVGNLTMIDFPQMVSTGHQNAPELFDRDFNGLVKFFAMKMRFVPTQTVRLEDITSGEYRLDEEVRASGFEPEDDEALQAYLSAARCDEIVNDADGTDEVGDVPACADDSIMKKSISSPSVFTCQDADGTSAMIGGKSKSSISVPVNTTEVELESMRLAVESELGLGYEDNEDIGSLDGAVSGEDSAENEDDYDGRLKSVTPVMQLSLAEAQREHIRDQLRRSGRGRGRGRGGGGGGSSRNHTKKINLYGKKVKNQKLDTDF
jgi:RIO kinase 2